MRIDSRGRDEDVRDHILGSRLYHSNDPELIRPRIKSIPKPVKQITESLEPDDQKIYVLHNP